MNSDNPTWPPRDKVRMTGRVTTMTCPECGRTVRIRNDRKIPHHNRPGRRYAIVPCLASNTSPNDWPDSPEEKDHAKKKKNTPVPIPDF